MAGKRENFYRRDPGKALAGMVGLTLEERGVYNTVLDLLYSTWRPLDDNRAFIANWCGCAVQKLNPILNRLIERGRLIRFEEGGRTYISDEAFEAERTAVKGAAATKSGLGKVGEKSGEVEEKSAGVGENSALLDGDSAEKQSLTPLERVERVEKKESPQPPKGAGELFGEEAEPEPADEPRIAFDLWNETARRCGLPVAKHLDEARRRAIRKRLETGGLDDWRLAVAAVEASAFLRGQRPGSDGRIFRADLAFVCQAKSYQRLIEGSYGQDAEPPATPAPVGPPPDPWASKIRAYQRNAYWNRLDWGPPPDKAGCLVPPETLMAHGYTPRRAPTESAA